MTILFQERRFNQLELRSRRWPFIPPRKVGREGVDYRDRPIKDDVPRFQQERGFPWYQRKYRRLVVRWERLPKVFDGFLALATIHLWITKIILVG